MSDQEQPENPFAPPAEPPAPGPAPQPYPYPQPQLWPQAGTPQGWQQGWQQPDPTWGVAPGWQHAMAPARTTNGWAVASLVTGILAIFPVALATGITALVKLRSYPERGQGMAIGGIVLGVLWPVVLAVAALGAWFASTSYLEPLGRVADATTSTVGACLREPDGDGSTATEVACSEPHDGEVYQVSRLAGGDWPGYEQVAELADEQCYVNFSSYVGRSYDESVYDYGWFSPDESEWLSGERRVVCVAIAYDEDLPRRSVRGSGE